MPDLGWPELLIIGLVIIVLFGTAKLPNAARSLGRSMRIFKSETKGLISDDDDQPKNTTQAQDAREQAARLREQAAQLEAQAGPQQLNAPSNAPSSAANGAPMQKTEHGNQS
jgi:sec-independent protein translocase protein TatA